MLFRFLLLKIPFIKAFTILIFNIILGKAVLYKNVIDISLVSVDSSSSSNFRDKNIDFFLISVLGLFLRFREKALESLC